MDSTGLKKSETGLAQRVADNFDQHICSQDGKIETSSMA